MMKFFWKQHNKPRRAINKIGTLLVVSITCLLAGCGVFEGASATFAKYWTMPSDAGSSGVEVAASPNLALHSQVRRGIYLWNVLPVIFNAESTEDFLTLCKNNNIDLVYCCFGQWRGEPPVLDAYDKEYASFIMRCNEEGIKVLALSGDPDWIYSFRRPKIKKVIQSYIEFNRRRQENNQPKFEGLSLDVEPYILPEWKHDTARLMGYYLSFLEYSVSLVGNRNELDVAVPYSYNERRLPGSRESFMVDVSRMVGSITVMAYINHQPALDNKVLGILKDPDLDCKVYIAFETNNLSEKRVSYYGTPREKFLEILRACGEKYQKYSNFSGMVIHDYSGFRNIPAGNISEN